MNVQHLQNVIRVLQDVHDGQLPFDMNIWFEDPHEEPLNCGTAACALGWCCRDKYFQDRKLYASERWGTPMFQDYDGIDAAVHFFDITRIQAEYLFLPRDDDNGPLGVIERVRSLMKGSVAFFAISKALQDDIRRLGVSHFGTVTAP